MPYRRGCIGAPTGVARALAAAGRARRTVPGGAVVRLGRATTGYLVFARAGGS
jgi:hypothetical protein